MSDDNRGEGLRERLTRKRGHARQLAEDLMETWSWWSPARSSRSSSSTRGSGRGGWKGIWSNSGGNSPVPRQPILERFSVERHAHRAVVHGRAAVAAKDRFEARFRLIASAGANEAAQRRGFLESQIVDKQRKRLAAARGGRVADRNELPDQQIPRVVANRWLRDSPRRRRAHMSGGDWQQGWRGQR